MRKIILLFAIILFSNLLISQITSFPWLEDFESASISSGWTQEFVNGNVNWQFTSGSPFGSPSSAYSGTRNAFFGSPSYDNHKTKLITPSFDLSALNSPVLSFYHIQIPWDTDQDELRIYYKMGESGSWQLLQTYTTAVNNWTLRQLNLPIGAEDVYIAFEGKSGYGYGVCIDNVTIYDNILCPAVSNLQVLYTTTESAFINWTSGGSESNWEIEYGLQGHTLGTGTLIQTASKPLLLEGLTTSENYEFYVRANCNPGFSSWVGPISFSTVCSIITNFPYSQGFESPTVPVACWDVRYANPSPPSGNLVTHSTEFSYEGNRALKFSSIQVGSPYNQYLISPQFTFSEPMNLTFRYRKKGTGTEIFSIGTSTTGNNIADFSWTADTYVTETDWKYYHIDIPENVKYISIQYKSIFQNSLFIDAFELKLAEACYSPIDLTLNSITYNSAEITWLPLNGETSWIIEYGNSGFIPGTGTQVITTTIPATISGLNYSTQYDVYVYANCGVNGNSTSSQKLSFTTFPACNTVQNFSVSGQTNSQISLSWTAEPLTSYEIEYGPQGFSLGTGTLITGISSGSTTISGLNPNTKYDFYIRAYCNETSAYSDYVGPIIGKTHLCSNGCYYTFNLQDYWGDGWGNVSLKILQNDQITDIITLSEGYNSQKQIFICNGATVQIVLNQGSFSDECSFEIYSNYNVLIYKQLEETLGSLPDQSILFIFEGSCAEPSCYPPINPGFQNLGYNSVDIIWTQGNDENSWVVEYGPSGFTPGTGTLIFNITQNNYHLTGLTPGQAYYVYVYSDCDSDGYSTAAGPVAFTTYTAPYPLDFCGLNIDIPDNSFIDVVFEIEGITPTTPYTNILFKSVEFVIQHPFVADIDMFLTSPSDITVELLSDVGGSGANFGDPTSCSFKTELSIYPEDGHITLAIAPFNGIFQAEGNLNDFNIIPNFNGLWKLRVFDDATFYTGKLQYFNINFMETSAVIFSGNTYYESSANDGSIDNSISANLYNLQFSSIGFLQEGIDFTISGLPEGLSCQVEVIQNDSAVIRLIGNALNHVYNVNNITFSFTDHAFITEYYDLINGKSAIFNIQFFAIKDLSLENQSNQTFCYTNNNIHVPYSITNTGEIEISSGTLINLSIEYPVGSPILNENIILTQNLNVGQTLTGTTANTLTLTNTGENILKTTLSFVGENITDNNSTETTYNLYYYEINFPQATNDTIIVNEFPFLVYTNAIFYPTESEELLYYEWNGSPGIDNIDVINTGWLYLFTSSSFCSRTDSVYIDFVSELNEDLSEIKIYPNPAHNFISIISNNPIIKFEIYDSQGRLISKQTIDSTEFTINVETIKEGVYYIIVFENSERKGIFRFIKI